MNEYKIIQSEYSYDSSDDLFCDIFPNSFDPISLNKNFEIQINYLNDLNNQYLGLNTDNNKDNHSLTNEENKKIDICGYEKQIDYKILDYIYNPNNNTFLNNNEINSENHFSYEYFSLDDIHKILSKKKSFEINKINFEKNKLIENLECKLCKKKRKREKEEKEKVCSDELKEEKKEDSNIQISIKSKRGRKSINNINRIEHNKMSSDNIIKKIKGKIFQYLVIFMNNILGRKEEDKNKIYKINYKYIDKVNKKNDLEILEKSLKDLLSVEITTKVKVVDRYFNKGFIERIINKEEPLKDYDTILFVLNIKLRDWLSLFTFKKEIDDIIKEKVEEEYTQKINKKIIEESLIGVDDLINQMIKENNEQFLLFFIFHLYNYERWFFIRAGRNIKS